MLTLGNSARRAGHPSTCTTISELMSTRAAMGAPRLGRGAAAAIASADSDWGVLRYLYVAPVTRTRLLAA